MDRDDDEGVQEFAGHSKPQRSDKFWIAYAIGSIEHPIVGAFARSPKPSDPRLAQYTWQPFTLWMWMLEQATHKPHRRVVAGRLVALQRGQFAASQSYIAKKANWTRKAIRVFLERLAQNDMIELALSDPVPTLDRVRPEQGQGVSIVTICNYGKYQVFKKQKGQGRARQGPRKGQTGARVTTVDIDTEDKGQDSTLSRSTVSKGSKTKSGNDSEITTDLGALPFSVATIQEIIILDPCSIDKLIADYKTKVAKRKSGNPIRNPDAYLLKMAREIIAKRDKITIAQVAALSAARTAQERATTLANVAGLFSVPSPEIVARMSRYGAERVQAALDAVKGRTYANQRTADAAFEAELVNIRFRTRAAAS